MKVLNFGSCNIDYVYSVPHTVLPGETLTALERNVFAGGKGLNQAVSSALSGNDTYIAGCIGADGEFLRELLNKKGVNTTYLKTVNTATGHAIIEVTQSGENSIIIYGGANRAITRQYADEVLSAFQSGDILLLQNEISEVEYLIEAGHKKGMTVVFNPSPITDNLKTLDYSFTDYLLVNETEANCLFGTEDKDKIQAVIKERYPKLKMVLTLGKNGCVYIDKDTFAAQPIFSVKAVDTTAAGDTFTGYFINGICNGKDVKTALKNASAASAIAVSRNGAAPSIPTAKEVAEFIKSRE